MQLCSRDSKEQGVTTLLFSVSSIFLQMEKIVQQNGNLAKGPRTLSLMPSTHASLISWKYCGGPQCETKSYILTAKKIITCFSER